MKSCDHGCLSEFPLICFVKISDQIIRSKSSVNQYVEVKLKESRLIPPGCRGEQRD